MSRIAILTDSGCDIPKEIVDELNIQIIPFKISFSGQSFYEMVDKTTQEFYEMMAKDDGIPRSVPLYSEDFGKVYQRLYNEGYTDVITVLVNSKGSETFSNAEAAKKSFYERNRNANMKIYNIDSRCYTMAYGYPVIEAAKKVRDGAEADEIISYLEDWFKVCAIYAVPATLKYAKKSGRVSGAVAFFGDLLKIKPIIEFADYKSEAIGRISGRKVVPELVECVTQKMAVDTPYIIIHGQNYAFAREVEKELFNRTGRQAEMYARIGCVVSANIGPDMVGVVVRRGR